MYGLLVATIFIGLCIKCIKVEVKHISNTYITKTMRKSGIKLKEVKRIRPKDLLSSKYLVEVKEAR